MTRTVSAVSLAATLALSAAACGGGEATPEKAAGISVTPEMLAQGKTLYTETCAPCHGPAGRGDGPSAANLEPKPRDHTDRSYMDTLSDQVLREIILYGGGLRGMPQMPSTPQLKDDELHAVVSFVRALSRGEQEVLGSPLALGTSQ